MPNGEYEGEFFKNLYDKGTGRYLSEVREQSVEIVLNTNTAEITVFEGIDKMNGPQHAVSPDPKIVTGGDPAKMILANAHTHQAADFLDSKWRNAANQVIGGDGDRAKNTRIAVYSYDSEHVDKQVPSYNLKGENSVTPRDNIAPVRDLFNCNFSICRDALKTATGQQ
jgi:hypothetical protein